VNPYRHGRHRVPGPLAGLTAAGVTVLVLAVAFSLHALDVSWAWVVYPLGFGGLLPMAMGAAARFGHEGRRERDQMSRSAAASGSPPTSDGREDALAELRLRYARGEVDEAEFERRVERLLETESVAAAEERYRYSAGGSTPSASTTRSR
jgi:hypothetical protein